jgi:hypothetical protein
LFVCGLMRSEWMKEGSRDKTVVYTYSPDANSVQLSVTVGHCFTNQSSAPRSAHAAPPPPTLITKR